MAKLARADYTVGWVSALSIELAAAQEMLDEEHDDISTDDDIYSLGRIGDHNVVLACLPAGQMGITSAATVAMRMKAAFPAIRFGLMVGIGGGVPSKEMDIRFGDVVVSQPANGHGGVIQYDFGKTRPDKFEQTGFLNAPPAFLLTAVSRLKTAHIRGKGAFHNHVERVSILPAFAPMAVHKPTVHYGTIASGNQVMRYGVKRDEVSKQFGGVLCFEMEAAGLMNSFPCLVIKGICDFADEHKEKTWQPYAAAVAAAYAKDLLGVIPHQAVEDSRTIGEMTAHTSTFGSNNAGLQIGVNYGPIHAAQSTAEPPPKRFIPFSRDAAFVERKEMDLLERKFAQPGARVVLAGLGGIGKSQLAIELCYRIADAWVIWLHASSATRFDQEVAHLLDDLDVAGRKEKDADIFQLLRGWLLNIKKWLVVLDNVDDADFLFEKLKDSKARIDYFNCTHGSLLITTRRQAIARRIAGDQDIILLEPDEDLAVRLLRSKLGDTQVGTLAKALDNIPLAVSQAAAYIKQRHPLCTIETYLEKLKESQSAVSLLGSHSEDLRQDRQEAEKSILYSWRISFEHISATQPTAANLLSLMSFYDHQGIPGSLLTAEPAERQTRSAPSDTTAGWRSGLKRAAMVLHRRRKQVNSTIEDKRVAQNIKATFEDDIAVLRDYSFISVTTDGSNLQMHRLVQLSAQVWLREMQRYDHYHLQSLLKLEKQYPQADFGNWPQCRALQAHVSRINEIRVDSDDAKLALTSILHNAASFAANQGFYTIAETMLMKVLQYRQRILGLEDRATLTSMNNLALTYLYQGRYDDAERLQLQVMDTTQRMLGKEHPDTLKSMSNLASTYSNQGRHDDAERLELQVLEVRQRVLGKEHPDTLKSMSNLALTYLGQGRYDDAERLQLQVMEATQRMLGKEHPDTLTSMGNLALTYSAQGRHDDAERLQLQVLEAQKRVLGKEHPATLARMNNLASAYFYQDRLQDAHELMSSCLQSQQRIFGRTHPDTQISVEWLRIIDTRLKRRRQRGLEGLALSNEHGDVLGRPS